MIKLHIFILSYLILVKNIFMVIYVFHAPLNAYLLGILVCKQDFFLLVAVIVLHKWAEFLHLQGRFSAINRTFICIYRRFLCVLFSIVESFLLNYVEWDIYLHYLILCIAYIAKRLILNRTFICNLLVLKKVLITPLNVFDSLKGTNLCNFYSSYKTTIYRFILLK